MNINDYKKFSITFHTDEGKFIGSGLVEPIIDDTAFNTIWTSTKEVRAELEKVGYFANPNDWMIVPISQTLDEDFGKSIFGEMWGRYKENCYKVEAIAISFSNELWESEIKPRHERAKDEWEKAIIWKPYVEEALGGAWICPGFLRNDNIERWKQNFKVA